ncbi:hypothetical protein [Deinococcus sp.]|uniref:hypothetical protein n=1 Tax=Deinococcus sp. TaxID=47478 RepID=UPI003B5A2B1F
MSDAPSPFISSQPNRLNGKSTASAAFDVLFGTIPALLFGVFSLAGLLYSFSVLGDNIFIGLVILIVSILGIYSCACLMFVTVYRTNLSVKGRKFCLNGLFAGLLLAALVFIISLVSIGASEQWMSGFLAIPALALATIIAAIKQIFMLI